MSEVVESKNTQKVEGVVIPPPQKEKANEEASTKPATEESSVSNSAQQSQQPKGDDEEVNPKDASKDEEDEEEDEEEEVQQEVDADEMISLISKLLGLKVASATAVPSASTPQPPTQKVLSSLDIEGVANYIKSGNCKNIVVMTGAGVSVAAGIPDFRTPGTGLYDNLQKYNLPYPTAVFEIDYFTNKPEPFFLLAKELYPGNFKPTYAHFFIRLLQDKGLILRNYTQNIDTLERCAGVNASILVEAHGSFANAHCINCKKSHTHSYVKDHVFSDKIPYCQECKDGLVKPDIVFFGENLPSRFFDLARVDFLDCDLLIVIGTSLQVQPFASLIKRVPVSTPRLLINMEEVGTAMYFDPTSGSSGGFTFDHPANMRDVKWLGDCQEGVKKLASLLGWDKELEDLVANATDQPPNFD